MARFTTRRTGRRLEILFDDGGMNLLSTAALAELHEAISKVDDEVRLLLFASAHERVFAAGADMQEMAVFGPEDALRFAEQGQKLFERIESLPVPTAVLIDGDCFGGALDLALAFDVRIATPRARFSHPGSRIGIVTGFGGTTRWKQLLSRSAAAKLFLGNPVIPAAEALESGLVDQVVESLDEGAGPLLSRMEAVDPSIVRITRDLLARGDRTTAADLHLLARRLFQIYSRS